MMAITNLLKNRKWLLFFLFLFCVFIQVIFLQIIQHFEFSHHAFPDYTRFYEPVAQNILEGKGLVDNMGKFANKYPPGFPLILSLIFGLYVIAADFSVSAAEGALPVGFRMETNGPRYEIGTPMLVRLTLRNVGEADFHNWDLRAIPEAKGHYAVADASRCRPSETCERMGRSSGQPLGSLGGER